ncbi:MAG: hypothetical protein ACTSRH_06075 [Promethearchaeota archaeon]
MMRHYYKSHGSHCFLRAFLTQCPRCGKDVLYWECTHGSKVFFEYPPYGKLIKHYCRQSLTRYTKRIKEQVIVRIPEKIFESSNFTCPSCGKLFKREIDLMNHVKSMKKNDVLHESFLKNEITFISNEIHDKKNIFSDLPKFGKITIKKKKEEE